ncbi:MAG: nucleotidyltransferase domain-containing protein [Planctomycetaceae bacterium]|jgi:predicted nucleotidyltransferase|nr:nucleotidyltransferase domain-containing protein [Planctomycetaceae bacterium]
MHETLINSTDVYNISEIRKRLSPVFMANGVKSAILFGSYARGEARPRSDVDVLVDSGLRGLDFVGLIGNVRNALQKEVDLIDVYSVEKDSRIDREIQKTGVKIYGE